MPSFMKFRPEKPSILDESAETLGAELAGAGVPAFRTRQVLDWV